MYHHGIRGQKWGVRRYQNEDGSLTSLGRKHYERDLKDLKKFDRQYIKGGDKFDKRMSKLSKVYRKPALTEFSIQARKNANKKVTKAYLQQYHAAKNYIQKLDLMKAKYGEQNIAGYYVTHGESYLKYFFGGLPIR